ncbi:MAG TPA: acetate--CoA ligase family protein [Anaerolineaceae bacterium]
MLNPKSIAVVGASERPGSAGRLVLENLRQLGYPGEIFVVNPKSSTVFGVPSFPALSALPKPVDIAAILLSADKVLPTLKEMSQLGIPAGWALASGFAEAGPDGKQRQAELQAYARETGILLCGPNCVGVANLVDRSATYSVALRPGIKPGSVSTVMQSGAILMGLANSARFGFRYLISSGNEAGLDSADYIGYLAGDPQTRVILAFLEGIRDADKFLAAARAAFAAGKPILALKVGRSEVAQRTVQAHTGSLAGSDAVLEAVFEREGILRFDNLDELVEAAQLFLTCSLPDNNGIGMLSLSGGQIGLISDLAQNMKLNFPVLTEKTRQALSEILPPFSSIANPLDAWGNGDLEKMYPRCVEVVSKDPAIGLIAMSRDTPPGVAPREVEQTMRMAEAAMCAHNETGKPVLLFSNYSVGFDPHIDAALEESGVTYLQGTPETLRALQAFERYAALKRGPQKSPAREVKSPVDLGEWRARLASAGEQGLDEIEARELLGLYGVHGPKERVAMKEQSAVDCATEIGFPVVLKIRSRDIQHKTEAGGVRVGLKDAGAVRTAFREIMESARAYNPQARLEGVIVQEMIPAEAIEVIVGVRRDASFGPVIVFGSGGILVELVKDSVLRLPPLSIEAAREMIGRTRGKKLLDGFRGHPAADLDALAEVLVHISWLAVDFSSQISALEINPLMVLPVGRGVRAVDTLIELDPEGRAEL